MRGALAPLIDRGKLAEAGLRLKAWWDGVDPDPEAIAAARALAEPEWTQPGVEHPRLAALQLLWGDGRLMPGDAEMDRARLAALQMEPNAPLLVIGPGLAEPVRVLAEAHHGPIEALEWRTETAPVLAKDLSGAGLGERVESRRIDLETVKLKRESAAGAICFDEFSHCDHPPRLALQLSRAIQPGGRLLAESYFGAPQDDFSAAFATAFAEPKIGSVSAFQAAVAEAGLVIEAEEDVGEAHLAAARAQLDGFPARVEAAPERLKAQTLRELAWEAQTWAIRRRYLASGRLLRRRFTLRRPA